MLVTGVPGCGRSRGEASPGVGSGAPGAPARPEAPRAPRGSVSAPPPVVSAPGREAATGVELDPARAPSFGELGPVVIDPPLPPLEHGMMDHSDRLGWTADSKEFGYCMVGGGLGDTRCGFMSPDGRLETLSDHERGQEELDPKKTAALDARIARHAVRPARWRYAKDLVITWEASDGSPEPDGPAPELRVGARVRGVTRAAFPVRLRGPQGYATIHAEAVLVSPDGEHLGVLAHAFVGEFSDRFEMRIASVHEVASQAYNVAGLEHHGRGDYARAATLFHRAAHASPTAKLPMYNLACALARLGDPKTEAALELAIARGGPTVKDKAARDPDFERVRDTPWFRALTR